MASQDERKIKSQFEALSKDSVFDILLPRSAELDVSEVLREGSPEDIQRAPSRRNLFFDERANVTLILKSPESEDDVRAILPSLEITLSAHATDAVPQGSGNAASASGKHDLTSKTFTASESVGTVSHNGSTYVAWRPTLQLSRPRARLQRPAVYFTAYLTISAEALMLSKQSGSNFLPSLEPLPANVLEALQFDPSLSNLEIYLPETRLTKVAPSTGRMLDDVKPLRSASKRAFPIVPALFTKVRYSYLPDAVVASLHMEVSQLVTGTVLLNNVTLEVPSTKIESLNDLESPREVFAADEIVLLYKLKRKPGSGAGAPSAVSVLVDAEVRPEDGPQIQLELRWQAHVDLSKNSTEPTYKWSRPLSVSGTQHSARPSVTSFDASQPSAQSTEHSVTFNFWRPTTIPTRKVFMINVQCINQSNRPRRFAIVVVQAKRSPPKTQDTANPADSNLITKIFNASPVERQKAPDAFDLNPDVRIGPLPPGASYETELRFWAATTGVLDVGVIRIVDLDTRQTVDVKELPDVVAIDPSED